MAKTLAVLTGGGHAAGLNAGIAGIIQRAKEKGWKIYGALDGWQGVVENMYVNLTDYDAGSSTLAITSGKAYQLTDGIAKAILDETPNVWADERTHQEFGNYFKNKFWNYSGNK